MENLGTITTVYLIRHAESADAAENISQRDNSPLSEKGRDQAYKLSEVFPIREADLLITSSMERSKETGKILNEQVSFQEIIEMPEVGEHVYGTQFQGMHSDNPEIDAFKKKMYQALETDERMEEVESIKDLSERATKVLEYLESQEGKKIVMVTHGTFLKTALLQMMFGKDAALALHRKISNHLMIKNAGYIRCIYKHDSKIWRVYIEQK